MREAYRAQQVTIDVINPTTPPMISLLIQRLELDEADGITAITNRDDRIYRKFAEVQTDSVEFSDPVTGASGQISVAGVAQILRSFANSWTASDYGLSIDPTTGWATKEDA